jgi:hypothetical protein
MYRSFATALLLGWSIGATQAAELVTIGGGLGLLDRPAGAR